MRVIAGSARRIQLKTLEGFDTRPTTDRIKETLFNMIGTDVYDANFLDLFSGSGAIGIEALSRGAQHAVFVENNQAAVKCIKENLAKTHLEDRAEILCMDAVSALKKLDGNQKFDLIFMDPPYRKEHEKHVLEYMADSQLVDEDALIIVEAALETDVSYLDEYGYHLLKRKEYKTNMHLFMEQIKGDKIC